MSGRALLRVLVLSLVPWATVQARESVSLRMARERLPVVGVRINGQGPFDFLLDTGSTTTVLINDLARSLQIGASSPARVGTPLGERAFRQGEVTVLSVGIRGRGPLRVLVGPLEELRRMDGRIQGILGLDWLSSFNFLIDFERRKLELDELDEERIVPLRVEYRLAGRRILVPVSAGGEHPPVWLVLDTGAESVVLANHGELAVRHSMPELVRLSAAGGSTLAPTGVVRRLVAGWAVVEDIPATLLSGAELDLGGAGGLLPGSLFGSVYVNHRAGYVAFDVE